MALASYPTPAVRKPTSNASPQHGHPVTPQAARRGCAAGSLRASLGARSALFEGSRSVKTHVTAVGTHRCHDWQSTSKGNVPVFHLRKVIHGVVDALVRLVADLTLLLRATGRESVSKLSTSVL